MAARDSGASAPLSQHRGSWRPQVALGTTRPFRLIGAVTTRTESGLLNRISKCFCVFANPSVPCYDHDQRRWLAKQLRCRQVHRVERTNRLDRKRSTDASENRVCDTDEVAATLKTTERAHCRSLFVGCQPRKCTRPKNRSCGFGDRQCGRDLPSANTDRFQGV